MDITPGVPAVSIHFMSVYRFPAVLGSVRCLQVMEAQTESQSDLVRAGAAAAFGSSL